MRPEHVKAVARAVLGHRLLLTPDAVVRGRTGDEVVAGVLERVAPPGAASAEFGR